MGRENGLRRLRGNPFYALLVVAGVAFGLTACVYGLALFRELHLRRLGQPESVAWLRWIARYGVWVMAGELLVLGLATAAAIGLDPWFPDPPRSKTQPGRQRGGQPTPDRLEEDN
jgi:hypothetical protein